MPPGNDRKFSYHPLEVSLPLGASLTVTECKYRSHIWGRRRKHTGTAENPGSAPTCPTLEGSSPKQSQNVGEPNSVQLNLKVLLHRIEQFNN